MPHPVHAIASPKRPLHIFQAMLTIPVIAAIAPAQEPIRVLALGPDRSRDCGTSTYAFASGDMHEPFRGAVLDPANFGAGGIIDRPIELTETDAFTGDALEAADVVILTEFASGGLLTPCEARLVAAFVEQGGGLFAWANSVSTNLADVLDLGETTGCQARGFDFVSTPDPAIDGPFGVASGVVLPVFACLLGELPAGSTVLITSMDEPMAASIARGDGRAVVMADDEWARLSADCPGASRWQANTRIFGLNALASVTPDEGFAFVAPVTCDCPADLDGDGELTIFDFLAFQNLFDAGDPRADFDGDGDFTIFDFLAFQNAFDAGCG